MQIYNSSWHHTGLQVWPQFHHEMDLQNLVFLQLHGVLPISLLTHTKFVTAQFIETVVWAIQWRLYKQRSLWILFYFIFYLHDSYTFSNKITIQAICILYILFFSYSYIVHCVKYYPLQLSDIVRYVKYSVVYLHEILGKIY